MWSYYGSKSKIAHLYPAPKHDNIIEPFAGTARYSYLYWTKQVTLVEKFDKIVRIWKYLQQASEKDILKLPDVESGEYIGDKYQYLCDEERWLIGFGINGGSSIPKKTAGSKSFNVWKRDKERIATNLHRIRHWNIILGDYTLAPDITATWFIDPPYFIQRKYYRYKDVDYVQLADWCKSRKGEVIVCENSDATWMDFQPLVNMKGQRRTTLECMWYRDA